jgi:hypothetical protein
MDLEDIFGTAALIFLATFAFISACGLALILIKFLINVIF